MSRAEFKKWMKANDLNEIDVASSLKMHPITVTRYLEGEKVRRSTEASFQRLMESYGNIHHPAKVAAGA